MFTDIVGYSKMIEKEEENALMLLEEHDQILTSIIKKNNGTIIKHIGDAIFAEFDDIVICTTSAIEMQSELRKRNSISRDNQKIIIRIGIHTGTVYEKENDLFGNDVNLCSRIESIAPHGGIATSYNLFNNLKNTSGIYGREIGFVKLKNIKNPQQLYKIYLDKENYESETENELRKNQIENGTNIVDIDNFQIEEIFSVGMLVMKSVSENKEENLGYIIADQIISHFQKIKQINMPNINDSQLYIGSDLQLTEIARRLEINNLIYGSISQNSNQITLNMNMLDTSKGDIVWSEKFIGNSNNLGILCGKIVESILKQFEINVPSKIRKLMSKSMTDNSAALTNYYQGMNYIEKAKTKEDLIQARDNFMKASEQDSNFVESVAQLAITCSKLGFHHESDGYIQEAILLAESLGSEGSKAMVYFCAGILFKEWNKYDKALPYFEKSLKIQVHLEDQLMEAKILNNLAGCYNNTANPDHAEKLLLRSIGIKERLEEGKSLAFSHGEMGNVLIVKGDFTNAILHIQKSLGQFIYYKMDYFACRMFVLLAHAQHEIGGHTEVERYLKLAHPICVELNEALMMGKIFYYEGKLAENTGNDEKAIENFTHSIEYFQEGELHRPLIYSIISLGMLQIRKGLFRDADKHFSKADSILKRISDPLAKLSTKINQLYLSSVLGNCTLEDCDQVLDKLKKHEIHTDSYSHWWIIAKTYYQLKSLQKAKDCQKKAQKIIQQFSLLIADKNHRKSFLYSDLIKKEIWLDLSKIDIPIMKKKVADDIYKFCPNCGGSNEDMNKFCSECGQNLHKDP